MPTRRLSMYLDAIGSLLAERSLDQVSATAAGSGAMQEPAQRDYLRSLRIAAYGRPSVGAKATEQSIGALGIQVEHVDVGEG